MPTDRSPQNLARYTLYIAATFIAFVGVIFHVDQMYLMAATLALLPWAAWLVGRAVRDGLAGARELPALCGVGEAIPVTLTLTNTGRLPKQYLRVADRLPRRLHLIGERLPLILLLRPGESRELTYFLEPERRGVYSIGPLSVETTDPLGFYVFTQTVGERSELAVYPTPLPLRRVFFEEAAVPGWRGPEAAHTRGAGTDFHGVREYHSGDELRHVHWRTTARTGRLSVAEYEQGAGRDTVVVLDLSRAAYAGPSGEEAVETAVTLAASLCDFLLRQGHAVRLLTPADAGDPAPPASGPDRMPPILSTLVRAEAGSPLSLAETLERSGLRAAPGMSWVVITPAMDDPALPTALLRRGAGSRVFVLALEVGTSRATPEAGTGVFSLVRSVRRGDDLQRVLEGG